MLDGRAVDLDACRDLGISIFAGEAEGRLDQVLCDAADGRLAPVYSFIRICRRYRTRPSPSSPSDI
jgi:hypothetical protein